MKLSKVDDEFGEDGFDIWEIEEEMLKIEKEEEERLESTSHRRAFWFYIVEVSRWRSYLLLIFISFLIN